MKRFQIGFYTYSIFICLILIVFALYVFPIPGTDSGVFIPPALYFSKGLGLANPLYYVSDWTDLTHTHRFNYYVPFFPYLLGLLSKINPGVKTIFFFCALFSAANLLLYTRVISSFLPQKASMLLKAGILLSVSYISTYLLPTIGRPETVTTLFVFLVYLLFLKRKELNKTLYYSLVTVLFSFMLSSQVICFFFCFLFFALYDILYSENVYKSILVNFLVFTGTLALTALIIQITPNGLVNTVQGIKTHMDYVFNRSDRSVSLFVHFWVFNNLNFFFPIILFSSAFFWVREVYQKLKGVAAVKTIIILVIILIILYGVNKFILYGAPTIYNATEFILPMCAYMMLNIFRLEKIKARGVFVALSLVVFISGNVIFLRNIILFVDTVKSGRDFDKAKVVINKFTGKNAQNYITNGLWPLYDNLDNINVLWAKKYHSGDTTVIQQAYHPAVDTSESNRYTEIYNWRTPEPIKFMGLTIANGPYGYGFVIYKVR